MNKVVKFIVAAIGAAALTAQAYVTGVGIQSEEYWYVLTAWLTAAGVWLFPNQPA